MKHATPYTTDVKNAFSLGSMLLMLGSAALRLSYYAPQLPHGAQLWGQLLLPLASAAVYLLLYLLPQRKTARSLCLPVLGGVLFFVVKALSFESVLHTALCCILYLGVAVLFCLTLCGMIRTKLLLYAVTGLPLLAHLAMDAVELAQNRLQTWQLEASVLCIMASLLCLSLSLKPLKIMQQPAPGLPPSCRATSHNQ